MTKQTTLRLPDELAEAAELVANVLGISVNQLAIDSLKNEIRRLQHSKKFIGDLNSHSKNQRSLLDRLERFLTK